MRRNQGCLATLIKLTGILLFWPFILMYYACMGLWRICKEAVCLPFRSLSGSRTDFSYKQKNANPHFSGIDEYDVDSMNGYEFEEFCAHILRFNGYEWAEATTKSNDNGADVIAYKNGAKYVIQCKNYSKPVGNKAVQEVFTAKAFYNADYAAVITNNYYTNSAVETADRTGVQLWNRRVLLNMMSNVENGRCFEHKRNIRNSQTQGNRICINCGNILSEGSQFCMYCGHKIGNYEYRFCNHCGRLVAEESSFCGYCGEKA